MLSGTLIFGQALGYRFDELPTPAPPQMREPPHYAVFRGIDVNKMVQPRLLFVCAPWTPARPRPAAPRCVGPRLA